MILKELKIQNFRFFYGEHCLKIEPDVTVLTGANDGGKSAILDMVRMMCKNEKYTQDDVNLNFRRDSPEDIQSTNDFLILATFELTDTKDYLPFDTNIGEEVDIIYRPNRRERLVSQLRDESGNDQQVPDSSVYKAPTIVDLSSRDPIRSEIPQSSINKSEDKLLELAFGANYVNKLAGYNPANLRSQVREDNKKLNAKLHSVRPSALNIELYIDVVSQGSIKFTVSLIDELESDVPIRLRGAGIQKLVDLMAALLLIDIEKEHVIILFDEPETSLHADAQHSFRYVLENFALHPHIQVIYATHSPAMINPSRPRNIRLLTRELSENGNAATTKINNKPYADNNFQLIRTQLGMSPADSLLYAPITVVIEGATESLGLNRVFKKLIESNDDKYKALNILIGLIHFVSAGGSQFSKWIEMAQSQGSKPIVFVDGDKIRETDKVKSRYPDVPIVHFLKGEEFENIVPKEIYFKALAEFIKPKEKVTEEAFDEWQANLPKERMFSKRVGKWVEETFGYNVDKPQVMDRAIGLAKWSELALTEIDELIKEIRNLANQL